MLGVHASSSASIASAYPTSAYEATAALMAHSRTALSHTRFLAICSPANAASVKLLGKLGLRFDRTIRAPGGNEDLSLFTSDPAAL